MQQLDLAIQVLQQHHAQVAQVYQQELLRLVQLPPVRLMTASSF